MSGRLRGLGGPMIKLVAFGVVTVLASYVLLSTITNSGYGEQLTYRAQFSDASGLVTGDEVRIAGVRVGQVTGIALTPQKEEPVAEVTFEVSKDVPLPRSVHATIRYRNLVGQRYISLTEGEGSAGQYLKQNAEIPLAQTKPALDLTILFGGFQPLLQALSPADVNRVSYEIIQVFQGEGGTVESLLGHVASLTSSLADKDKVIGSVIENLTTVMSTVAQRDQQLSDLIVNLQQFVSGLAEDRNAIFDSLQTIDQLASTTAGFLSQARPPLAGDIKALGQLAGNIARNGDQLQQFLQLAPTKIDLITRTAINGSWFNFFMCSYNGTIVLPGTGLLPDPVTGVLPTLPPGVTPPPTVGPTTYTIPPTKSGAQGCG
jgi:phospholipid/cholesterol/gamma-HCH transport system substrate-binding protein